MPFTRAVVEKLRRCRLISLAATGYDDVNLDAVADADISVCAIEEYCTEEVADHVMLLILAMVRRLPEYHEQVQRKRIWQYDSLSGIARMRDLTLGIIGFGRIGQALARRARGFGMTIIANDHSPVEGTASDLDVQFCELSELLSTADVISLNCLLTNKSQHIIDTTAFQSMHRNPILINCARGGLVDESALIHALDTGQISGAALDVLNREPPDLQRSELTGRRDVILTPHVAFYSDASILKSRHLAARNILYAVSAYGTDIDLV
jgi:phosphoglycerate dehydrogenase-like enzyme